MRYNEIPEEYKQFVTLSDTVFDSLPEEAQILLVDLARARHDSFVLEHTQVFREEVREFRDWRASQDIVSRPAVPPQNVSPVDYYLKLHSKYTVDVLPSHMGITDRDYHLNEYTPFPSRWDFVNMIRSEVEAFSRSRDTSIKVVNVCVSYVTGTNSLTWISFSKKEINEVGLDKLLQYLKSGEEYWEEDFYGGSSNIREFIGYYALNTGGFRISLEKIEGGYGEIKYDYYNCISIPCDKSNNCLIECFKRLETEGLDLSIETI
jgi:hypothetical protein